VSETTGVDASQAQDARVVSRPRLKKRDYAVAFAELEARVLAGVRMRALDKAAELARLEAIYEAEARAADAARDERDRDAASASGSTETELERCERVLSSLNITFLDSNPLLRDVLAVERRLLARAQANVGVPPRKGKV